MNFQLLAFWSQVRSARRYKWLTLAMIWLLCLGGWALVSQMPDQFKSEVQVKIDSSALVAPMLAKRKIEADAETRTALAVELLMNDANIRKIADHAGAVPQSGESQEKLVDAVSADLDLEPVGNDIFVLSAIQNDPQSSLLLLKSAITTLGEIAHQVVEADASTEIQSLERKLQDVEEKLREIESIPSFSANAPVTATSPGSAPARYQDLRTEWNNMSKRLSEVRAEKERAVQSNQEIFRVLAEPLAPNGVYGPNRIVFYGVILFGALALGALLAMSVNLLRPTLSSARNLKEITGLPVLGCIQLGENPVYERTHRRSRLAFVLAVASLAILFLALIVLESKGLNLHHLSRSSGG